MNYKISVPVLCQTLTDENLPKVLKELERCKADRVFIAVYGGYLENKEMRDRLFADYPRLVEYYKKHGYEIGAWIQSSIVSGDSDVEFKRNYNGEERKPWRCHGDEKLIRLAEEYATFFAEAGVDLIMYDDDFSAGGFGKANLNGCSCIHHRNAMKKLYGEDADFDYVVEKAAEDKPSKEREMFENTMGFVLEEYARRVRSAVDKVNPNIRMGIAVTSSNYGVEGTTVEALSEILAGKTKPFARMIGAPYWNCDCIKNLNGVFESERYQSARLKKANIENMCEGDVFPRPRTAVGSTCLELFNMALLADGNSKGILKYMIDYYSDADYETGYIDRHIENMPIYEEIEKRFSNKTSCGVRIFNDERIFSESDFSYAFGDTGAYRGSYLHQSGAGRLTQLGLPTSYDCENSVVAVFGENGRFIEEEALNNGAIIDMGAAMALIERGIDVGLEKVCGDFTAFGEYFEDGLFHRNVVREGFFEIIPNENAKILSEYVDALPLLVDHIPEMKKTPAAYLYENSKGQRFMVYNFLHNKPEVNTSYARAEQIKDGIEWAGRCKLPAKLLGKNPHVYIMCKKDENSLSVGLWNLSQDKVSAPEVVLDKEYKSIEFINCNGALDGDKVTLSTLSALEFCGFEVQL